MKRIFFIVLLLVYGQIFGMESLDRMSKSMRFKAISAMSIQDRKEALEQYPELAYFFPKSGAARNLYIKHGEEKAVVQVKAAKFDAKKRAAKLARRAARREEAKREEPKREEPKQTERKGPEGKEKKKKKKKKKSSSGDRMVTRLGEEKRAPIKSISIPKMLEFFGYLVTNPDKYPTTNYSLLEQLLDEENKEAGAVFEQFVLATGFDREVLRQCIELQHDYSTELAKIEMNKQIFLSHGLIEVFFNTYNQGLMNIVEQSKQDKKNAIIFARGTSISDAALHRIQKRFDSETKQQEIALQVVCAKNKKAKDIMMECHPNDVKDIFDMVLQSVQRGEDKAFNEVLTNIESMLKLPSDIRFVEEKRAVTRQFVRGVKVLLNGFDKHRRSIFINLYKIGISWQVFEERLKTELALKADAKSPVPIGSVVDQAKTDIVAFCDEGDESSDDEIDDAESKVVDKSSFHTKTRLHILLKKFKRCPHRTFMKRALNPKKDSYTIAKDDKGLEVTIPGKNIKILIANVNAEQKEPWFTCYGRNIGKKDKQDDEHMMYPPIFLDAQLKDVGCCENKYVSSITGNPIVIKNFPVQVHSLDGKSPVQTGCLQLGIENGACFHRMWKEYRRLDYGLQFFVDRAFGQA